MTAIQIVRNLLDYGAAVFLPLIMLLIGLLVGLKFQRALSAALILGVAFTGMSMVIGFMTGAIGPAGQAMVKNTGLQLIALDVGWTPTATIAWAWPYAALMFLVQIGVNMIMLAFRWTETLNVDMWNVWHKAFLGSVVAILTGSTVLAFVVCAVYVALELRSADLTKNQVSRLTKIPGVSVPHNCLLEIIWMAPINWLLDHIPGLQKIHATPEEIREKVGFLGENQVVGFFIGILLGIAAGYDARQTLTLAIQAATALVLLPLVASLFMQALAPISEAAGEFMKRRFPGRQFYIGLDWPILAGQPSLWTAAILNIPLVLLCAALLPGNRVLPFASIALVQISMGACVIAQGDLFRTWLFTAIGTPIYFYLGTYFGPVITQMAQATPGFAMPEGIAQVTNLSQNGQGIRYLLIQIAQLFQGKAMPGIVALVAFVGLYWFYNKEMKKKEAEALERMDT